VWEVPRILAQQLGFTQNSFTCPRGIGRKSTMTRMSFQIRVINGGNDGSLKTRRIGRIQSVRTGGVMMMMSRKMILWRRNRLIGGKNNMWVILHRGE
jgi:hypothetical protein